jgi:hypothetical protein
MTFICNAPRLRGTSNGDLPRVYRGDCGRDGAQCHQRMGISGVHPGAREKHSASGRGKPIPIG